MNGLMRFPLSLSAIQRNHNQGNWVVSSESLFANKFWFPQWISFCNRTVLSIVNKFSQSNCVVCGWTFVSVANQFLVPNCVVCSKSVFAAELWYQQRISFRYQIKLSTANLCSLQNCVVGNESVFAVEICCCRRRINFCCRIVLLAVNQFWMLNYGVYSESVFTAKLWFQQRISFQCQIHVSTANQFSLLNYNV